MNTIFKKSIMLYAFLVVLFCATFGSVFIAYASYNKASTRVEKGWFGILTATDDLEDAVSILDSSCSQLAGGNNSLLLISEAENSIAEIKSVCEEINVEELSQEDRQMLENIKQQLEAYVEQLNPIFESKNYSEFKSDAIVAKTDEIKLLLSDFFEKIEQQFLTNFGDIKEHLKSGTILTGSLILVLSIGITFVFLFIILDFIRPIKALHTESLKLAAGNVNINIKNRKGNDEIAMLYSAVDSIARLLHGYSHIMDDLARGDYTTSVTSRSDRDSVAMSIQKMLNESNEMLSQISSVSDNVNEASRSMLDAGLSLSKASTDQASALEEITATVTQIAIQSKQISENSSNAKNYSDEITSFASDSKVQMDSMLESMKVINTAANDIAQIIMVIDEIAFQTNMLALNASVEAARAGQEGKGFAVVANEVRSLAGRSAKAAKETEELIHQAIEKVEQGSQNAESTAKALSKILEAVNKNAPLIDSISVATEEQYAGIEQVNQAIEQVSKVTDKNSKFAEESAMASQELTLQAEQMRDMVGRFQLKEND